jgi:hypothetical protein
MITLASYTNSQYQCFPTFLLPWTPLPKKEYRLTEIWMGGIVSHHVFYSSVEVRTVMKERLKLTAIQHRRMKE